MAEGRDIVLKHLSNFINALIAIAPSRNYITQFLYIVRAKGSVDYRILEDAYPDILKDEDIREALAKAFNISFSDKISLEGRGYGQAVTDYITLIFSIFESQEFRSRLGDLLKDEYPQGIPNLVEEWLEVKLKGLSSEPTYGKMAIKVLKELMRAGRLKIEEFERILNIGRGDLIECLNLLDLYNLIIKDYDGSYKPSEYLRKYPDVLKKVHA